MAIYHIVSGKIEENINAATRIQAAKRFVKRWNDNDLGLIMSVRDSDGFESYFYTKTISELEYLSVA